MKKVLFVILMMISQLAFSSHYMGGEITWECNSYGNFKFTMKVYRECAGINYPATVTMQTTVPGFGSISMSRLQVSDISPQCNTNFGPHITCYTTSNPNTGGVEEHIYTSDTAYPNGVPLTGVPPPNGWVFSYNSCCRNPCSNIIGSNGMDWFLRAIMYPYNNTNVGLCFDNSPKFEAQPETVVCAATPIKLSYDATDSELDSLAFEWSQPLDNGLNNPITAYTSGYSYLSPLPGQTADSNNIPASIDPYTGEVSFTSFTQGAFLTVVKVTAYKCGIKVAEIFKEFQVVLLQCDTNTSPIISPPFMDTLGLYTLYTDTVFAGAFVSFPLFGTDMDTFPDGSYQTISFSASGAQFGTTYSNPLSGCPNPPCATLSPPPPLSGFFTVGTYFNWQTDLSHVDGNTGCNYNSRTYNFVFEYSDDYCPVPQVSLATVSIVVKDFSPLPAPKIHCTEVLPNGDVILQWDLEEESSPYFDSYHIYSSVNRNGPFFPIDSIFDESISTYTHIDAEANQKAVYYQIRTRSGIYADVMSEPGPTVSTIFLYTEYFSSLNHSKLVWNNPENQLSPTSAQEYRILVNCPFGNWTFLDNSTDTIYLDTLADCNEYTPYRIELIDTVGFDSLGQAIICSSLSNSTSSVGISESNLENFVLFQSKPNPSTDKAIIEFKLPHSGNTKFHISNLLGQPIFQELGYKSRGLHQIELDSRSLPSGIYFYSIEFEDVRLTKKMIIAH